VLHSIFTLPSLPSKSVKVSNAEWVRTFTCTSSSGRWKTNESAWKGNCRRSNAFNADVFPCALPPRNNAANTPKESSAKLFILSKSVVANVDLCRVVGVLLLCDGHSGSFVVMGAIHDLGSNQNPKIMEHHLKLRAFNFRVLATLNTRYMPRTLLLFGRTCHLQLSTLSGSTGTTLARFAITCIRLG